MLLGTASIHDVVGRAVASIGSDITIGGVFASYQEEQNFNSIWGVRSSAESAASAGSVVELVKASGWSTDDIAALQLILYNGMGARVQEGYGQGRIWTPLEGTMVPLGKAKAEMLTSLHKPTRRIAKKVLEKQIILNARLHAAHDVDTYIKRTMDARGISKHFASVLLAELGTEHATGDVQLQDCVTQTKADKQVLGETWREFQWEQSNHSKERNRVHLVG